MTLEEKLRTAKMGPDLFRGLSEEDKRVEDIMAKISSRILRERLDRKLSQEEFARLLGVSQVMVSKWESGDYNFSIKKAVHIFNKLNVSFDIHFSNISIKRTLSNDWKQQSTGLNFYTEKILNAG